MSEATRRVSFLLPEPLARLSKSQAALSGVTYDQYLRSVIEEKLLRIGSKEVTAAAS